jgi:hypothetical protein
MRHLKWFVAGALAVPLFHQVTLAILNALGSVARAPFSMTATKPFGVPQVVSLSFWGGVWGVILGLVLLRLRTRGAYWLVALLFGAVLPTLVAVFLVAPLKGQAASPDLKMLSIGFLVNAAWGVGTAALALLFKAGR